MMVTLPLQEFIDLHTERSMQLQVKENTVDSGATDVILAKPNALSEALSIVYPKVTFANANIIEQTLRSTRGTERISYLSKKYIIDGYEVTYSKKYARIALTLLQVG